MAFLNNFGFGGPNSYFDGGFNSPPGGFPGINGFNGMPFLNGPRNGGQNVISQNLQNGGGASNVSVTPQVAPRPSILSPTSGQGPSSGVNVSPIDVILNDDVAANDTPIVPAGAYDYGSGKVYTAFTTEDVVEGGTKRITSI